MWKHVLIVQWDITGKTIQEGKEIPFTTRNYLVTKLFDNAVSHIEDEVAKILDQWYGF